MNKKLILSSISLTHINFGEKASNHRSKVFPIFMLHASNIVRHCQNASLTQFKTQGQICIQNVPFRAIPHKLH